MFSIGILVAFFYARRTARATRNKTAVAYWKRVCAGKSVSYARLQHFTWLSRQPLSTIASFLSQQWWRVHKVHPAAMAARLQILVTQLGQVQFLGIAKLGVSYPAHERRSCQMSSRSPTTGRAAFRKPGHARTKTATRWRKPRHVSAV